MLTSDDYRSLLLVNLVATAMMTGLIWLVQLVHYPMFEGLDRTAFARWHEFHSSRITWIVAPLMIAELGLCLPLIARLYTGGFDILVVLVVGATLLIWLSTFLLSVPLHSRLGAAGFSSEIIHRLVWTNWPRTVLYSIKLAALIYLVGFPPR